MLDASTGFVHHNDCPAIRAFPSASTKRRNHRRNAAHGERARGLGDLCEAYIARRRSIPQAMLLDPILAHATRTAFAMHLSQHRRPTLHNCAYDSTKSPQIRSHADHANRKPVILRADRSRRATAPSASNARRFAPRQQSRRSACLLRYPPSRNPSSDSAGHVPNALAARRDLGALAERPTRSSRAILVDSDLIRRTRYGNRAALSWPTASTPAVFRALRQETARLH